MTVNCIILASKWDIFIMGTLRMYFSHRKIFEINLQNLDGKVLHNAFKPILSSSFTFVNILHLEIDTHFLTIEPGF